MSKRGREEVREKGKRRKKGEIKKEGESEKGQRKGRWEGVRMKKKERK